MNVYVALGSNLGDRRANLLGGVEGMARRGLGVDRLSSVWETEPVDSPEPLWFLNMAARICTRLGPFQVLEILLDTEKDMGRVRAVRNAPRQLDLDLLLMGDLRCSAPRLALPHPRMWQRRFVLAPLGEIAPDLRDPASGRTVLEVCGLLPDTPQVRRLGPLAAAGRDPGYNPGSGREHSTP